MKKTILKSACVAVAAAASSFGAWKAYDAYEYEDNSLLMQNIEALASDSNENGNSNNSEQFPIVPCGYYEYATTENRGCWHVKVVQCKKACFQFANAEEVKQWKKGICSNKNYSSAKQREILSQVFCTGPKTYFHLTEEAEQRGYCINTEHYN